MHGTARRVPQDIKGDILKMLRDLLGYVRSHDSCNLFVDVLDRRALNQLVNLYYVFLISDGNAKRHKVYTGSGNGCPTSSLRD